MSMVIAISAAFGHKNRTTSSVLGQSSRSKPLLRENLEAEARKPQNESACHPTNYPLDLSRGDNDLSL
jgi:hypothetical protein